MPVGEADPDSPRVRWGRALKRHRTRVGLTQEALAEELGFSGKTIGAYERGERTPSQDFARRADDILGANGELTEWHAAIRDGAVPTWFRPWQDVEQSATAIYWYEPLIIPGLVQTASYAGELLGGDERLVAARLQRQSVYDRADPPVLRCLIYEGALKHPVGNSETMIGQLEHLVSLSARPNVTVQVVPYGVYAGMQGACALATSTDGEQVGYLETAARGVVVTERQDLAAIARLLDEVRTEALPSRVSVETIQRMAEQWT